MSSLDDVYPDGDPGAVICRWCRQGRVRQGLGLICRLCDGGAQFFTPKAPPPAASSP